MRIASGGPDRAWGSEGLHVTHVLEAYGGVQTWLLLLLDHWHDPSITFSFVTAHDNELVAELRRRGHDVRVVPMPRNRGGWGELRAALALRRELADLGPDVVHLHSSQAGVVGRLAWARRGRAVVYTPHAYYYLGKEGWRRQVFLAAERALDRLWPTQLLATSPSERARGIDDVGVAPSRASTLLNAVEPPLRPAGPRSVRSGPLRVGMVGRICPQKEHATFLRAVRRLLDTRPGEFEFHLVGTGHYDEDARRLDELSQATGVTSDDLAVHPWMDREDLLYWLDSCDVVTLTSAYESFGYALAEAQMRGIPVVGTDVDGIRDVVVPGWGGLLVPRGDDGQLAEALMLLRDDPEVRARLGRGAARMARERFAIGEFVLALETYYRGLVDRPATPVVIPAPRTREAEQLTAPPTAASA